MGPAAGLTTSVAVVGNGPVGQTAALLLARYGVDVVVLEQRPARQPVGSRSICQQRDVLDVWSWVGAGEIATEGVTWSTARTLYRDRELFSYDVAPTEGATFPPFVNISQYRTEQILDERIGETPLVDVRWGWQVVALRQSAGQVDLECATPDGPTRVSAQYVLSCTGARDDVIRPALGVKMRGSSYDDMFLICDVQADLPGWARERRFYFDPVWNPGRQVLIHPCPDTTYRIDWQVAPDYDLATDEESGGLHQRITDVIGDRPYRLQWRSVYRFGAWLADRFAVGRVLLVGDAAHAMAPFGARGLNSGVQDADNAAWKLAFALAGDGGPGLVASYGDERRAAAEENLDVVGATMDFLVPHTREQFLRRQEILAAAVDDEAARARVESGRLAEPFWYVDSPVVLPRPGRRAAARPPRGSLPDSGPGVLLPDVTQSPPPRLRERCRGRLTALGFGSGAATTAAKVREEVAALQVLAVDEIDPGGGIRSALTAESGEVWLVRPDLHVAAVLAKPGAAELAVAVRRALGHDLPPAATLSRPS